MKLIYTIYSYTCDNNINCHEFSVLLNQGYWKLECWGASGGDSFQLSHDKVSFPGGKGGYSVGVVYVANKERFELRIGGKGTSNYSTQGLFSGGFNGGGGGIIGIESNPGGSGGGATFFRWGGSTFYHIFIVAGGGGGAGVANTYSLWNDGQYGGAGGGINGSNGGPYSKDSPYETAFGATQKDGGNGGYNFELQSQHGEKGSKGTGASVPSVSVGSSGGGGGGGYYGGGSSHASGGGGGSGYIGGVISYRAIKAETINGENTFISPYGGYERGHDGNGYIRITDLSHSLYCTNQKYFNFSLLPLIIITIFLK